MAEPVRRAVPHLERIQVPRVANVLAEQLRHRILSGQLEEGDVLPSERAMVEQTGLGRASVREALRILEVEGLIAARLGRYGGWSVQRPGQATVARSIDVFIRGRQIRFGALLEMREAMEPACAALAARNRTAADLAQLDACSERLAECWRDVPEYLLHNVRWHLAVVAATHNELLIAVMSALADAVHAATDIDDFNSDEVRHAALRAHDGVTAAIRDGDADAAFRRMHRHVRAFRLQAEEHLHAGELEAAQVTTGPERSGGGPAVARGA